MEEILILILIITLLVVELHDSIKTQINNNRPLLVINLIAGIFLGVFR